MRPLPAVVDAPEALFPDHLGGVFGADSGRVRGLRRGAVWEGGYSMVYQVLLDWEGAAAAAAAPATRARSTASLPSWRHSHRRCQPSDVTPAHTRQHVAPTASCWRTCPPRASRSGPRTPCRRP